MLSCRQIGKLISEGKKRNWKGSSAGKPYPALIRTVWGLIGSAVALDQVQNGSGNLIGL